MDDLNELWDNSQNSRNQACILGWAANEFADTLDYNELEDIMQLLTL